MLAVVVALVVAQPPCRVEYYPMTRIEEPRRRLLTIHIELGRDRRTCYAAPAPVYRYAAPPSRQYYQPAPRYSEPFERTRFDHCGPSGRLSFERSSPGAYSFPGAYSNGYGCPPGGCPTSR